MRRRRVGTRRRRTRKPLTGGAIHNRNTRHTRPRSPITATTKPATTTAPVHVIIKRMDELSPSEMNQIDGLIKEAFTTSLTYRKSRTTSGEPHTIKGFSSFNTLFIKAGTT